MTSRGRPHDACTRLRRSCETAVPKGIGTCAAEGYSSGRLRILGGRQEDVHAGTGVLRDVHVLSTPAAGVPVSRVRSVE